MNDATGCAVRLHVLGRFELVVHRAPVELPLQAQRVLGYLAVVRPAQSRSTLAGCLWADTSQDRAMATLRNALWRLRKASGCLVHASRDSVHIGHHVWVDLAQTRRCVAAIDSGQEPGTDVRSIEMLDTDLLTGWEEDWLHIERERLRQMRVHALESLADTLMRQGRHAQAIQAALAAVRAEPLRETAQATLIRAHLTEGNTCEAIRQLESFRRLLADELGIRPSPRVESLLDDHTPARSWNRR